MKKLFTTFFLILWALLILQTSCSSDSSDDSIGSETQFDPKTGLKPDSEVDPDVDPDSPISGLIFETNFGKDTDYSATGLSLWNGGGSVNYTPPWGWDGIKAGSGLISVQSGKGINGSNALRLEWPEGSQPTLSLGKHLTGDVNTGYDQLYIRYHVRLPENFKAGDGSGSLEHWKWGRLWQNTWPTYGFDTPEEYKWTENRANSKYIVWNMGGGVPYTDINVTWGENSGNLNAGSSGGDRQKMDYFVSGTDQHSALGYFESLWDINTTDNPGFINDNSQDNWHTLEFHFKLATTTTSDDGEFQMWWNGVDQGPYINMDAKGGAPQRNGIPTARDGSGLNFFTFFDNIRKWNVDWEKPDVNGGIYVNDLVISTERIGHDHVAGNSDMVGK